MRPLAELKGDLEISKGLGDIIDVLKTAALIQFRIFQQREKPNQEYMKEIMEQMSYICAKEIRHPYLFDRKSLPALIMVVTSDEGFLGELNTLLINASLDLRKTAADEIVVLGERGTRYLEDMNENFSFFPGITDEIDYKQVCGIRDYLLNGYRKKFGRILVLYPRFLSLTVQHITTFQLLPYFPQEENKAVGAVFEGISVEPTLSRALEMLIELWAGFSLLDIFWSAKQSEFAARIMHLEQSTQELGGMNQKLAFEYFRQVHTLKDKVIREISATKVMLDHRNKTEEDLSHERA